MDITKGALDAVVQAIDDLGANRLPLPMTTRLHNARKVVAVAIQDREGLRLSLVKPYLPEGKDHVEPTDPGYGELIAKLNEMFAEEIALELGAPISLASLNGQGDKVSVQRQTLAVLEEVGLLVSEA